VIDRIGNCRILGEIGAGGMAVVYKAVQEPLGRIVAVKALKSSVAVESQFAKRFEREAMFLGSLQHENLLHVHDFIKYGGTMFIVMEYVEGIDLYDLVEKVPQLPVDVAAIIALQVARALDYVHFRGIIHRDIKPANVMISTRGEVKLMDFGIARDESLQDLTETGTGVGTPSYMSPEQILGDKLDPRSDLFSLGIVTYQMVAGRKPFLEDDTRSVMQKIRLDRYTAARRLNPAVPRTFERILARAMEKLPADRFPSAQAMIHAIEDFLHGRVTINYAARIVTFLEEHGLVSREGAQKILEAGGAAGTRTVGLDGNVVSSVARVHAALLGIAAAVGIVAQVISPSVGSAGETVVITADQSAGVRVVAEPWAEIWIDGRHAETTPLDRPIPLTPGVHVLQLKNPAYETASRTVTLRPGQIEEVRQTLVERTHAQR
jgi:serine/threonine-protein kinase